MFIGPSGTVLIQISINMQTFSLRKIGSKSVKLWLFCTSRSEVMDEKLYPTKSTCAIGSVKRISHPTENYRCTMISQKDQLSERKLFGAIGSVKTHLHCIKYLGPSIRVRARTQSKQVNWCFVFTLVRIRVRDFCLGRPCPSLSLHVAIFSDSDVRVRPRLCNAHARSHPFTWSLLHAIKMAMVSDYLGSEPRMQCTHNSVIGSDTDLDTDARTV